MYQIYSYANATNITYSEYSSVPMVNHLAKSFQEVLLVKDVDEEYKE